MKISLITSNISADFLNPPGIPGWDERKLPYIDVLRTAEPDIIGLQEVTPGQLQFLQTQLAGFAALTVPVINPTPELLAAWQAKYERFGFPQIPSPYEIILFYRPDVFELLSHGYWWLSPTPNLPSIGFGNIAPRAVLWAHVQHRASGKAFVIFNTHIDHRSTSAMVNLCQQRFSEFAENYPSLVLMGDLNFNENDPNYDVLITDGWCDSHNVAAEANASTFLSQQDNIPRGRIDHILFKSTELMPLTWKRLLPPVSHQRISDHDPVHVEFQFA